MNIVGITNKIASITVVLLIYWVFIFVTSIVFGFKVFRENITEMFSLSILGLFAILSGAIILNIMFNLTAIAEHRAGAKQETQDKQNPVSKVALIAFIGSLVAIFFMLYLGDLATSGKRERYLVQAASDLIREQKEIISRLADYSFSRTYIENAAQEIRLLGGVEEKFPKITIILPDRIGGKRFLLEFSSRSHLDRDEAAKKADYILSTSSEERQYLYAVFDGETTRHRFSANDGEYELYYPIKTDKGHMVIYLSQYGRYGKMGSY